MRTFDLQFNFSNLTPELASQIKEAIDNKQPFGLTNGRVLNLFDPGTLKGAFSGRGTPTSFQYQDMAKLLEGVGLSLLSCKEFVSATDLFIKTLSLKYRLK